jgi:hypothetical protein
MSNKNEVNEYIYVILLGILCFLVIGTMLLGLARASEAVMDFACTATAWGVIIILFIVVPLWLLFSNDKRK